MTKTSKKLLLSSVAFAMTLTGISAAQAADTPYTYSQYLETQGYKNLLAASETSAAKLSSANGVVFDFTMTSSSFGQVSAITGNVKATHTAVVRTSTMDGVTDTASYFDGSYYLQVKEAATELAANNSSAILAKRLPNSAIKSVKLDKAPDPESSLSDLNPSYLFSGDFGSNLTSSMLQFDTSTFTFGEVTSSPNVLVPTSTDYKIQMKMTDSKTGMTVDVQTTETFNSDGLLTDILLNENVLYFGMPIVVDVKLTQTIDNTIVLTEPDPTTTMASANFITLDKQISAEASQKPNANKILTKAKALAKSSKKALSSSHIVAAAKALKIKAKSVTNGIKLTGKYKGVTGNLCVTVTKGAASTKNC